ncbi:MAG: enoyl-[acyl-carrier-protein] reductase FabK [Epulopiscium sp.]|nr:enoyl-[acyl-carrier-protein] reductase FabK [Candidatus Epulonipiscium sp.]
MYQNLCSMLGINYPIIQGGMAWVANHALAAAVSQAGGLGIIASGNAPTKWVREEIRKCKELTDRPFGVNIMLLSPYADEVAHMIVEEGVKVVTTGAGNPARYVEMWKDNGIKFIPVVPSVAIARKMEKVGADAIIVEGCEAGGHIGELTTMALVPQASQVVSVPVIAAGGIGDGRGVAAAFMLGAKGVQMGTRFLVAHESPAHKDYKQRVIKASDIDAVVTGRSTGHPVRSLRNQLSREYIRLEKEGTEPGELDKLGEGALQRAVVDGDINKGVVMAGQISGLVTREQSAKEIIDEVWNETEKLIRGCDI